MTDAGAESAGVVDVVGASAGTGKTFRLVSVLANVVGRNNNGRALDPSEIIVTTFTNKAADEIIDRIRQRLIAEGEWEAAQAVLTGHIGTVNSVCGRLIAEFALDAGISPVTDVLPEERTSLAFAAAVEPVIAGYIDELDPIARRLSQDEWRNLVLEVSRLARSNGIDPQQLKSFAARSWTSFKTLLPEACNPSQEAFLDDRLADAIKAAVSILSAGSDSTKATRDAFDELKRCAAVLKADRYLPWSDWAKLSKLKTARASKTVVEPVREAAAVHARHPRLHKDLQRFINLVFSCASEAMEHYQSYKRLLAFMDFTDQEALAFALLRDPQVVAQLRSRVSLVLVDEFQDTSPIQLAIFLLLARIARRSVWVGDEKQAIYGFRDTDPELMQSVIRAVVPQSGGSWERLTCSYRTVPELVRFTNDVFGAAFPRFGITAEQVAIVDCKRASIPRVDNLNVWWLAGDNWQESSCALAAGVAELLAESEHWPVFDSRTGSLRPLQGGDIAILCRRNERCVEIATALANVGIPVAASRHGLLSTPECSLAFACLRFLVDYADTLAAAEILHFTSEFDGDRTWLVDVLEQGLDKVVESSPYCQKLARERHRLAELTPGEAMELAITTGGVVGTVTRWTNFRQRLSNLNAMRALAIEYEELSLARRSAATAAGFVTFLFTQLEREGEQPPNPDEKAVRVLTYHCAKGLEWPMVLLSDLGAPKPVTVFGATVESPEAGFDPWQPLKGRSIRLWPWPYGQQEKGVYLDATADACLEMAQARARDEAENVRLLYVGATRARDYLMFVCRTKKGGTAWLDALVDAAGQPVLVLPDREGKQRMAVAGHEHPVSVRRLELPQAQALNPTPFAHPGRAMERICLDAPAAADHPPMRLQPSRIPVPAEQANVEITEASERVISLGGRLPISGAPDMAVLGEAVHRFLAADEPGWTLDRRLHMASDILRRWHVTELEPQFVVQASDRLLSFLADRYAQHHRLREWPVHGRLGSQRVEGRIDLLVETAEGFVVIDHKTFPGPHEHWVKKAYSHRPQLALYADLVKHATGRAVTGLFVHMPIVGRIVDVTELP